MIKKLSVLCFSLFMIFVVLSLVVSAEFVGAQTLVAGKIYNSDYSSIIEGVDVTVTCKSSSLNTVSLNDGTYAVRFEQAECTLGDAVKVTASKGTLSGENSGTVITCEGDEPCGDSDYVAILNLNIKTKTSSSGGSSSSGGWDNFYLCGNGRCDSGETAVTCSRDCRTAETAQTSDNVETTETSHIEEVINLGDGEETEDEKDGLSGITGAVTGALGELGLLIPIIFLICLIVLYIVVMIIRKRKRLEIKY